MRVKIEGMGKLREKENEDRPTKKLRIRRVAVGGTFDRLHDGHVAILSKAFELGERVVIGVCSDEMVLAKDLTGIQPLETRKRALVELLRSRGWLDRTEIEVISDPFGPAKDDADLQAIVVSPETVGRARELNKLRGSKGLKPLQIIEIPFVLAEDHLPISSLRIRYGEVDPHGKLRKPRESILEVTLLSKRGILNDEKSRSPHDEGS